MCIAALPTFDAFDDFEVISNSEVFQNNFYENDSDQQPAIKPGRPRTKQPRHETWNRNDLNETAFICRRWRHVVAVAITEFTPNLQKVVTRTHKDTRLGTSELCKTTYSISAVVMESQ